MENMCTSMKASSVKNFPFFILCCQDHTCIVELDKQQQIKKLRNSLVYACVR